MKEPSSRLTIELEPGDPIHGRLIEDSGCTDTFYGWLELCQALEWARHRPGAPSGVSALAGIGQATVGFDPLQCTDGPIASYTVTASPGGATARGGGPPVVVTGLTKGLSYTFTVTAANSAGVGPPSSPSNVIVIE